MSATRTDPQEREIVFCHECEEEWYRDEHGLICPSCQSDFTEVIEDGNDPREDIEVEEHDHFAPDPDEDDITQIPWMHAQTHHGQHGNDQQPGGNEQGGFNLGGGLIEMFNNAIRAALNPQQHGQEQEDGEQGQQQAGAETQSGGQPRPSNGTFVHHYNGQSGNFSYTITTTSNATLLPRDANNPQPFQPQPAHINDIMNQLMMNLGAVPTVVRVSGPGAGMQGQGGAARMPINIMSLFGGGDRFGDAVFSQEALDRVITQLMEQHQSGNAPGPASEQAIESLPRKEIGEKDLDEQGKAECSICMDETPIGTSVTVLPCSHWFHHDCVKAWLTEHDTCPHCRRGITARDEADRDRARDAHQEPLHNMNTPGPHSSPLPGSFPFPPSSPSPAQDHSSWGESLSPRPDTRQARPPSNQSSSGNDLFSRMREAFGGGSSERDNA